MGNGDKAPQIHKIDMEWGLADSFVPSSQCISFTQCPLRVKLNIKVHENISPVDI